MQLLFAPANHDPEHRQEPGRFDTTRRVQDHVGFGVGFHVCIDGSIARLALFTTCQENRD